MSRVALCICLLLLYGCQKPADFVDAHGLRHSFSDYQGKWVLVNYWATWCGPCRKEIPELNKLARTHSNKLVLLGVDYDQPTGKKLLQQIHTMKIKYTVMVKDPGKKLGIEAPQVLPTTYVFAPGMKFKKALVGPQTGSSILAVIDQASS